MSGQQSWGPRRANVRSPGTETQGVPMRSKSTTIRLSCLRCGKEFGVYPSGRGRKYCGMECRYNPPNRHTCATCGREFLTKQSEQVRKFCSRKCRMPVHAELRFWTYVKKTKTCWLWTGAVSKAGYGNFDANIRAHRFSWQLHFGPIPEGLCVLHKCDVPGCVRPDHLFLGTNKDNSQDAVRKGRLPKGEQHPQAKLTSEQVSEIRLRCRQGEKMRFLATVYGVCFSQISRIIRCKSWRS